MNAKDSEGSKKIKIEIIYGLNAVYALLKKRPGDIEKIYIDVSKKKDENILSPIKKWASSCKMTYEMVDAASLEKIAKSVHHEGIVVLARRDRNVTFNELLQSLENEQDKPSVLIFLDEVGNPHNIGAILRTAAHFGVRAILGEEGLLPDLSPSTRRIAVGAAETVLLVAVDDLDEAFKKLKKIGFCVYSTFMEEGQSIFDENLSKRAIFIFGSETVGISKRLSKQADKKLFIPGTGQIESLNVSCAAAIILAEYFKKITK